MSLQPGSFPPVPEDTAQLARKVFKKGHLYLTLGDEIGTLFADTDFTQLYATDGAPACSPGLLALVTLLQCMEDLPDRAAVDAVRGRIEWKYALHLPLEDAGFDASLLCDFRQRLVAHAAGEQMFHQVLQRLVALKLLRAGGQQRTDGTRVLAAVRVLNRLELLLETLRLALEALADYRPQWLQEIALPHWYARYSRLPRRQAEREALALSAASDGFHLLQAVAAADAPSEAASLEAVALLRQVWQQQLVWQAGQAQWRATESIPPAAELIATPHDPEARYSSHGDQHWTGYQVHWSETCDEATPHLITQVETVPATTSDVTILPAIQAGLATAQLLPATQLVDAGYTAGHTLASSQAQYGIDLLGPVAADTHWQAQAAGGITADQFQIDWEQQQATCPAGQQATSWSYSHNTYGHEVVQIRFSASACQACALRLRCTQSQQGRSLKLKLDHPLLVVARQRQQTPAFRQQYAKRAGIEGTFSAAIRRQDLRHSRYIGLAKTHLQALLTAMAVNVKRAVVWLMGKPPQGTRPASLACLAPALLSA